jgi:hypothetical protein
MMPTKENGWIGIDLDGTLADDPPGMMRGKATDIGPPLRPMIDIVRRLVQDGWDVRVFTARVSEPTHLNTPVEDIVQAIWEWTEEHIGKRLPVTNIKSHGLIVFLDDRALNAIRNRGITDTYLLEQFLRRAERKPDL